MCCVGYIFQNELSANGSLLVSWWRIHYLGQEKPPKQALSNGGIILDRLADSPHLSATSQQSV